MLSPKIQYFAQPIFIFKVLYLKDLPNEVDKFFDSYLLACFMT